MKDCQLAKVFVQGYQDTPFSIGLFQNAGVPGVLGPIADPHYIMAGGRQLVQGSSPDAGIQEQFQLPDSNTRGSIRSLPTTRRA